MNRDERQLRAERLRPVLQSLKDQAGKSLRVIAAEMQRDGVKKPSHETLSKFLQGGPTPDPITLHRIEEWVRAQPPVASGPPQVHEAALAAAQMAGPPTSSILRAVAACDVLGRIVGMGKLSAADAVAAAWVIAEEDGYSGAEHDYVREWEKLTRGKEDHADEAHRERASTAVD